MSRKNSLIVGILCFAMSCNSLTDIEKKELVRLRQKFPNYDISKLNDLSDSYIKVRVKSKAIDTLELVQISNEFDTIKQDTLPNGQTIVEWNLVVVYDVNGKYLLTIGKEKGLPIFFRNGVN